MEVKVNVLGFGLVDDEQRILEGLLDGSLVLDLVDKVDEVNRPVERDLLRKMRLERGCLLNLGISLSPG